MHFCLLCLKLTLASCRDWNECIEQGRHFIARSSGTHMHSFHHHANTVSCLLLAFKGEFSAFPKRFLQDLKSGTVTQFVRCRADVWRSPLDTLFPALVKLSAAVSFFVWIRVISCWVYHVLRTLHGGDAIRDLNIWQVCIFFCVCLCVWISFTRVCLRMCVCYLSLLTDVYTVFSIVIIFLSNFSFRLPIVLLHLTVVSLRLHTSEFLDFLTWCVFSAITSLKCRSVHTMQCTCR